MEQTFQELPHWSFSAEEVSAGVYRVKGKNSVTGANLEVTVAEPESLFAEAKTIASQMDQQTRCKSQGPGKRGYRECSVVSFRSMNAKAITPILNVSDIAASFAWFAKWGWRKCWDWGTPPTFGAVGSGECEIFLCLGGQGGRGKGTNTTTFQRDGDEASDKGAWMSIWVQDVDEVYRQCLAAGVEVTFPPTNMPWNVREVHLRHPDGHVFRVSKGIEEHK